MVVPTVALWCYTYASAAGADLAVRESDPAEMLGAGDADVDAGTSFERLKVETDQPWR